MKITLCSIFVQDQAAALRFYTEVLGFVKKQDIPMGEYSWLTLISNEGHSDVELVLEPNAHPAAATYQKALYEDQIPITSFQVTDVKQTYDRLKAAGVTFVKEPFNAGPTTLASFDDTCGNIIQIHESSE